MPIVAATGERYTLRRKVFKLFGAGFHIYDAQGGLVAYCEQKAFKLREDLRLYTDESKSSELLRITTKQILDINASYTVMVGENPIGVLQRRGIASAFLRDEWHVLDPASRKIAELKEESSFKAFLRRYVDMASLFLPQRYVLTRPDGRDLGGFRQHFNLFVYRLGITILDEDEDVDDLLILALACMVAAIEGRQQ